MSEPGACPLCSEPLYGWIALPAPGEPAAAIGIVREGASEQRIVDRCEHCGVAVERGREVDLEQEWEAVCRPGTPGERTIAIPNRSSLQAWIGEAGWAGIGRYPGRLIHTPESLRLLARANGAELGRTGTPVSTRGQAWMWQTLLNGLTFHPNFAREVRAGRLRPGSGRGGFAFAIDAVVTILGAPLVALLSVPLELGAAAARRGGELVATARPASPAPESNGVSVASASRD